MVEFILYRIVSRLVGHGFYNGALRRDSFWGALSNLFFQFHLGGNKFEEARNQQTFIFKAFPMVEARSLALQAVEYTVPCLFSGCCCKREEQNRIKWKLGSQGVVAYHVMQMQLVKQSLFVPNFFSEDDC